MRLMLQKLGRSANAEHPVPLAIDEVIRQVVKNKGGFEPQPVLHIQAAGMGIGAFESREYIHELGGRLDVISTPGLGTTFNVILPMHRDPVRVAAPGVVWQEDTL